jgi:hypothetical protein
MSTYVPPHLRNKTKYKNKTKREPEPKIPKIPKIQEIQEIQEIKITDKDFPNLVNTSKKNDATANLTKSFAEVTEKEEQYEVNNNLDEIKAGWSIIKRDEKLNIVILDSKKTIETKKKLELIEKLRKDNIYLSNFRKMIQNWNYFRDVENELRGDLSPYYYYKEELKKMIKEDLKYEERLHEYQRRINSNSDSDDDNESNRHLIY